MPDYSPWGATAMSGLQNWNPPTPTAPTPPSSPSPSWSSGPGFDVSPPGGLGGGTPPAPKLPGGTAMAVPQTGQAGMGGGMTMSAPVSNAGGAPRPAMPAQNAAAPPVVQHPPLAQQPGVSGLGPLQQPDWLVCSRR